MRSIKGTEQKACVKAQEARDKLGVVVTIKSTYTRPVETKRKFRCVEGAMFRFNESTGKYEKYDYMENIPGTCLKK